MIFILSAFYIWYSYYLPFIFDIILFPFYNLYLYYLHFYIWYLYYLPFYIWYLYYLPFYIWCIFLTAGLDTKELTYCPTDQHLVRLAGLVPYGKLYELVTHLGLPDLSWKNIVEQYRGYDLEVVNFFDLCKWRQQKYKEMETTSFKDLSVALTAIDHHRHVLCQVGNN